MKRAELLERAKCDHCDKPIGHTGLPLFWTLSIERFGIDLRAVQRQDALGTLLGNHALGAFMGPDEDMAKPMMDKPAKVTLCENCAMEAIPAAVLAEVARDRDKRREQRAEVGDQEDDADAADEPYCGCNDQPTIEEADTNQCDSCGKPFA